MRFLTLGAVLVAVAVTLIGMTPFQFEVETLGLVLLACVALLICEGWVFNRRKEENAMLTSSLATLNDQLQKSTQDAAVLKEEWRSAIRRSEKADQRIQELNTTIKAREEAFAADRSELHNQIKALEKAALDGQALKSSSESEGASGTLIAFLGQLQEHGRFLDFVSEEVSTFTDAQVAGAARFVHAGCRRVVRQYVEMVPVKDVPAGSTITISSDEGIAAAVRIIGHGNATYPVTGKLIHGGWRATRVTAPIAAQRTGETSGAARVISPAEVEVAA